MSWNLEGHVVSGQYLDHIPVRGVVVESRVKYGGRVSHTIQLDSPIEVFGDTRVRVSLEKVEVLR